MTTLTIIAACLLGVFALGAFGVVLGMVLRERRKDRLHRDWMDNFEKHKRQYDNLKKCVYPKCDCYRQKDSAGCRLGPYSHGNVWLE